MAQATITSAYPEVVAGPPQPSQITVSGSMGLPLGTERYHISGHGAALISVDQGDHITIENLEGGQVGEVIAAGDDGRFDLGLLGVAHKGRPATGLQKLLASGEASLTSLRYGLSARGLDITLAEALVIFGADSLAKSRITFTANRAGIIIIAAPGATLDFGTFDNQNTTTPLIAHIKRATIHSAQTCRLPDPLAEPLADFPIPSATAKAYFVKAGDYIQVIDKDGRQCTDFQCFSARKLDKGIAQALDVTTTRTLMGTAYPMPGLHGKYYDHDMLPLLQVIQDTCGRHDAFALACAAKYYDEIGYPGHVNCSENFNNALAPFQIAGRTGWMAINFFFNTAIDAQGVLYADEPWSRPGDYVLLRALTDLVCVSSACPDDTSPANGWRPSDIHIRVYDGTNRFQHAIAHRPTPEAEPHMTQKTAFYDSFAKHTRHFVDYNGYWLAQDFAGFGALAEYKACREAAVILDLSALRKFEITGPDSAALCDYVLTRKIAEMPVGAVVYSAMCYPHGGMIDDGTLIRLGRDNFRWIGGSDYGGQWMREVAEKQGLSAWVRASTDTQHNIAIQGPNSRDLLREVIWTAPHQPKLDELAWFRATPARIATADGAPFLLSRTGYTGELGYEIFCHPKDATTIFDAIWQAGQDYGLIPMGLAALDMVRIEAGLIFAGYEFDDQTDPFEAGIGFTVPLKSKQVDFIGREALIRRKQTPSHKLVGLEIASESEVGHGDPLYIGRAQIGIITSAMRSAILGKHIALARVDVAYHEVGTKLEIGKLDGHQKRLAATIVPFAHYDPQKTKPQS